MGVGGRIKCREDFYQLKPEGNLLHVLSLQQEVTCRKQHCRWRTSELETAPLGMISQNDFAISLFLPTTRAQACPQPSRPQGSFPSPEKDPLLHYSPRNLPNRCTQNPSRTNQLLFSRNISSPVVCVVPRKFSVALLTQFTQNWTNSQVFQHTWSYAFTLSFPTTDLLTNFMLCKTVCTV